MDRFLRELGPYLPLLLKGLLTTCKLCGIAYLLGIPLGALIGYFRHCHRQSVGLILRGASFGMTAIPFLVLLFWLHYPLQRILEVVIHPEITGAVALTLLCAAFVSDALAAELERFPKELVEMSRTHGLGYSQIFWKLQIPYLVRLTLPQVLFVMVTVLHASLFCSLISVQELFRVAQAINSELYRPVEIYTGMALFLFLISAALHGTALWLRRRWQPI
jgi:polar amino acid transport system permease protein